MVIGMTPDLMSVFCHPPDNLPVLRKFRLTADEKKCRFHISLLQFIQKNIRHPGFWSVIKSQGDHWFLLQIGCHTYHHVQMTTLSENQQKQEILQWYQVVSGIIGDFSYALRPPYGCVNNAVCRSLNVPVILWSVDTEDWTGKSAGEIADYVISETKDGDIILLHDIFEESVQGAVMALDDLMRRGYTFVTVNDLLADRGIAIQSGKVYRQAAQGGK